MCWQVSELGGMRLDDLGRKGEFGLYNIEGRKIVKVISDVWRLLAESLCLNPFHPTNGILFFGKLSLVVEMSEHVSISNNYFGSFFLAI